MHRSLFQKGYVDILNWKSNPGNEVVDIVGYRIYLIHDRQVFEFLGEVSSLTFKFINPNIFMKQNCTYDITAVTADGQESLPAAFSIQHPSK